LIKGLKATFGQMLPFALVTVSSIIPALKMGTTMNNRNCYCPDSEPQAAWLLKAKIPYGFCGVCDNCGQLGHTRHYPGPVPYTGSWCDVCYEKERLAANETFKDEK